MTRPKREPPRARGARRDSATGPARGQRSGSGRGLAGWGIATLVGLGVLGLLWLRGSHRVHQDRRDSIPSRAMHDSARVAITAHRWEDALDWGRRMAEREPRNPSLILGLGAAYNNLAWGGVRYERERTSMRTSLERARFELHALALMDSASDLARTEDDWDRSELARGETFENLGLPIDALEIYENVLRRSPGFAPARGRAAFVLAQLRDPTGSARDQ